MILVAYIAANIMTPEEADAVWMRLHDATMPWKPSQVHQEIMTTLDDLRDHPFDGEVKWQTPSSKI